MEKKQKERKKTKIQTKALKHYKKSEILSNANYNAKQNETKGKGLKIHT